MIEKEIQKEAKLELRKTFKILADALEEWQKDQSLADTIYNEKLSNTSITKAEWQAFRISYDTPKKLARMRSLIPRSLAEEKERTRRSLRKEILVAKLRAAIISDVSVSKEEIERYYQQKYSEKSDKPKLNEVKDEIHNVILLKKKQEVEKKWWQNQYKKAKIEIKIERFKDVLKTLNPANNEGEAGSR